MILDRGDIIRDLIFMHKVLDYFVEGTALDPQSVLPAATEDPPPVPRIDETDDAFTVRLHAPDLSPNAVEVTLQGRDLTIQVAPPEVDSGGSGGHSGRRAFRHTWRLSAAIEADQVEARYDAGTLTVTLPKTEASRPRRIAIGRRAPVATSAAPSHLAPGPKPTEQAESASAGSTPAEIPPSTQAIASVLLEPAPSVDQFEPASATQPEIAEAPPARPIAPNIRSVVEDANGGAKSPRSTAKKPTARAGRARPKGDVKTKTAGDGARTAGKTSRPRRQPAAGNAG